MLQTFQHLYTEPLAIRLIFGPSGTTVSSSSIGSCILTKPESHNNSMLHLKSSRIFSAGPVVVSQVGQVGLPARWIATGLSDGSKAVGKHGVNSTSVHIQAAAISPSVVLTYTRYAFEIEIENFNTLKHQYDQETGLHRVWGRTNIAQK